MSDRWKWELWEDLGDKYEFKGSQGVDKYNVGNSIKPVVSKSFMTELHCILNTTEMSILLFKILA